MTKKYANYLEMLQDYASADEIEAYIAREKELTQIEVILRNPLTSDEGYDAAKDRQKVLEKQATRFATEILNRVNKINNTTNRVLGENK